MKPFLATLLSSIVIAGWGSAHADELQLDNNGCHRDGIYGKYHCHQGKHAGESFVSVHDYFAVPDYSPKPAEHRPVKLNKSGVCVTPGSILHKRQKNCRTYPSVGQCLRDGGHLDKTLVVRN